MATIVNWIVLVIVVMGINALRGKVTYPDKTKMTQINEQESYEYKKDVLLTMIVSLLVIMIF